MSINKRNLLQLLLIISLAIGGCWARPKSPRPQQPQDSALNEATSQEFNWATDQQLPSNLLEQLPALRTHKKRRPSNHWKPQPQRLQLSQFRRRFYNVPEDEVMPIPPGGANYYGNEVLPLSTYEIYEPEPVYSTAYY